MKLFIKKISLLVLLVFCFCAFAQEQNNVKVGLVLSGGGAKGMAHIGAIKVIEEAGIKIDYIGGTSMGAIVGALYASGYSATELDSIFRNTDFFNLIQDNLPRSAKTFYEKEDSERYALTLPFNNFKITFPQGYSGGRNIYSELVKLLYHVKDVEDFSELPIPFVCVATNVETGKEVVLNKGYLPEAILASGTLPSLFEPTKINNQILIDGGVVNNYPIDKVKEMGANFIIGVDVQHGLSTKEELSSATEILMQINNFRAAADMQTKSKETDIYIKPEIKDYSVLDFDDKEAIIETGLVAARFKMDELYKVSQKQQNKTKPNIEIEDTNTLKVDRLILTGDNSYSRGYIKGKLRFKFGEEITFKKLQQGLSNLYATGNFVSNRYKLTSSENGEDLSINLEETIDNTFLRLGVNYNGLYKSSALINITRKNLLLNEDVTSLDLILGDNIRYNFQYYVDKGLYWSFGIESRFNQFEEEISLGLIRENYNVFNNTNINTITLDVSDITNQIYVQTVVREEFAFRAGLEHKFLKYSTLTLSDVNNDGFGASAASTEERTHFEKGSYYSAFSKLILDTYDDKYFPSRGLYFNGDFQFYALSSDFNNNFREFSIVKAKVGTALPITNNFSLNVETDGGFKLGSSTVSSFDFVLGGYGASYINNFTPFIGYDFLNLVGNSYIKAYGRLDYEFIPKNHFMFSANFANVDDDIFRTGEWFTLPNYSGYGISYGFESFIGPLQIMYSWSPEIEKESFFFSIGYWF